MNTERSTALDIRENNSNLYKTLSRLFSFRRSIISINSWPLGFLILLISLLPCTLLVVLLKVKGVI